MHLLPLFPAAALAVAPVIGIYPTSGGDPHIPGSYYDAYREWVAQEGATSVVFPASFAGDELERLFQSVNGFLIPGGGGALSPSAAALVRRAADASRSGDYFPVWGTCLGFEWIVETFGGTAAVTGGFDSEHYPAPLNFTPKAAGSRTYAAANATLMEWLSSDAISYNAHVRGVTPAEMAASGPLSAALDVLSTSVDRKGRPFVAQFEARGAPIYGAQFHAEKIQFVATSPTQRDIPRSAEAVAAARHLARFLVAEAAKSAHAATPPAGLYQLMPTGTCTGPTAPIVSSAGECGVAAEAVGERDTVASVAASSAHPKGCFIHEGQKGAARLWWHAGGNATYAGDDRRAICRTVQ